MRGKGFLMVDCEVIMSVCKRELKCYEYINAIRDVESLGVRGLYGADKIRVAIHDELCEMFNLSKERTTKYTDNLDKLGMNGSELFLALLDESKKIGSLIEPIPIKSDETDCNPKIEKNIPLVKLTKKELNFLFLRLQYYEIMKIGAELGLVTEDDHNGIKDYELTSRFIQRAEKNNIFEELSKKVLSISENM